MNGNYFYKNVFSIFLCLLLTLPVFTQMLQDVTASAGLTQYASEQHFGTGVSCFDIDGDGWLDLHVSTSFGKRDLVYKNLDGQGFQEVSNELGLNLTGGSIASIWMDYDGDRLVDLLVANSCNEVDACEGKNLQLFKQEANGHFTEMTHI